LEQGQKRNTYKCGTGMSSTFQHRLSLICGIPQIGFEERYRWKSLEQISLMGNRLRKNILLNKKTKIIIDYLKLQTILASVNQDALSKHKLLKAQTQLNVCQLQC